MLYALGDGQLLRSCVFKNWKENRFLCDGNWCYVAIHAVLNWYTTCSTSRMYGKNLLLRMIQELLDGYIICRSDFLSHEPRAKVAHIKGVSRRHDNHCPKDLCGWEQKFLRWYSLSRAWIQHKTVTWKGKHLKNGCVGSLISVVCIACVFMKGPTRKSLYLYR